MDIIIENLNIGSSIKTTKIEDLENTKLDLEKEHQLKIDLIQSSIETLKKDRDQEHLDFNE